MTTARVAITVQGYAGLPELGLQLTEAASDIANFNRFQNYPGDALLIARNSDASIRTVQYSYFRRGQLVTQTAVNVAVGKTMVFGPFSAEFGDHLAADAADGDVYVNGSVALLLLSVLRIPGLVRG